MISTVSSPLFDSPDLMLCYYVNSTTSIQQASISGLSHGGFKRVIFPQQRIMFEAHAHALLNVYTHLNSGRMALQQIPCSNLKVNEKDGLSSPALSSTFDRVQ